MPAACRKDRNEAESFEAEHPGGGREWKKMGGMDLLVILENRVSNLLSHVRKCLCTHSEVIWEKLPFRAG